MNQGGHTTTERAHAKLTLSLRVTGVRSDGYHLIDAEMVSLDLADELTITRVDDERDAVLTIDGPFATGVPTDDTNLVMKAMRHSSHFARVHVTKNVPHGGGLGGGSSDAAAYLRAVGAIEPVAASAIGADVPFCLREGRARVRGIGEIVEALPHVDREVTLVVPPIHVSTPLVYATWDALGGPHDASSPLHNDLEPAAMHAVPELARWKMAITEATGISPTLAGSGGTWFVLGHHPELVSRMRTFDERTRVVMTRTVPASSR